MKNDIKVKDLHFSPFISSVDLKKRIQALGREIFEFYGNETPIILPILNGSFIFAADLIREINLDCQVSFVKFASYNHTSSSGEVKDLIGLNENFAGKRILIIEDIVDTGRTMTHLLEMLKNAQVKDVNIATLLFKKEMLKFDITPNFVGFEIPNRFVVGFGLDYDGYGRHYDAIYALNNG